MEKSVTFISKGLETNFKPIQSASFALFHRRHNVSPISKKKISNYGDRYSPTIYSESDFEVQQFLRYRFWAFICEPMVFSILLMDICQRFIPTLIMKPPIVKLFLVLGISLYDYNDLKKLLILDVVWLDVWLPKK